ncbi:2-N-acetylglucosaminyltransferase 1 (POMGnT1), partial [Durusdinium trenchii]
VLHDQEHLVDFDMRLTEHYREAISYAVYKHFPKTRSLIIVEEDMEAANDMLWYFTQLEPLLHEDPKLWCIAAWNDNGKAPFAEDLTGLMRSDVFAGSLAWMLPAELYRKDLLLRWPSRDWAQHFRSPVMAAG